MDDTSMDMYRASAEFLKGKVPPQLQKPRVAIICGSGLGGLAGSVQSEDKVELEYASIPHFTPSTVQGHAGKLVFGYLSSKVPAVLMVGRTHHYEGHSIERITFPVRVFKLLGVETVVVTNAAGGLNSEYAVGDIVILNDHIFLAGLAGTHPLRGPNLDAFGSRFPPLSDAYDLSLRRSAHLAWQKSRPSTTKRKLHEGVYAFVGGPSFETRAECRLLHQLGADLVGMSTVPEVIVARHCGIRILAMSLVTNNAVLEAGPRGDDPLLESATIEHLKEIDDKGKANHEEVLEEGRLAAVDVQNLVAQIIVDIFPSA